MAERGQGAPSPPTLPLGGAFDLIDHHGHAVSDYTYRGQFMLLFFGFTHCRVVCPRALARLSGGIDRLGPAASCLRPLYVTVDPDRDTPEVMRAFLKTRYPKFTGLTGSRENVDRVKALYKVFASRAADPDDAVGYQMPHTAFTYLIGPDGRYVAHFTDAIEEDELANRLRKHLPSSV
jgi:protein SCO1/2